MGTYVPSASWRLVWALASLKSADERITIEGFYDDVLPVTKKDEEILNAFPYNEKSQLEKLGLTSFLRGKQWAGTEKADLYGAIHVSLRSGSR